jgi:hypothetical protein
MREFDVPCLLGAPQSSLGSLEVLVAGFTLRGVALIHALRPYARRAPQERRTESPGCEICGSPVGERHAHVLRRDPRQVVCSCAACAVLFRDPDASRARYRTIPERVLRDPTTSVDDATWAALGVPVGIAFFIVDEATGRCTGHCPSPAGAVQIDIEPPAWDDLRARVRIAREMAADVEALLVHRPRGGPSEVLVVPVDACYSLAGLVRTHWRGFDGGDDARRAIQRSIDELRARAREPA